MKILWLSLCPPYKEVKHAGGQALYKHVLSFLEHKEVEIKMVSLCKKEEYEDFKNEDALTILLDVIDRCRRNV